MPVLDLQGRCVGLIDAESWTAGFFDDSRVSVIARCAMDLAPMLGKGAEDAQARKRQRCMDEPVSSKSKRQDLNIRCFENGKMVVFAA